MSNVYKMHIPRKTSKSMQKRYNLRMMKIIRERYKSGRDIPVISAEELHRRKDSKLS